MTIDIYYILLLIISILPIFYKLSFWFYTIQLKEYRIDRFKEYLSTLQWKNALFNFWFFLELPLLIISLTVFFNKAFENIVYPITFYFLLIQNIFVLWKIFRLKIKIPKFTKRLLVTKTLLVLILIILLYFVLTKNTGFIYLYILSILNFTPIIIFISIFISCPLINYIKNKILKQAIIKSQTYNKVIKIWVTWSYWKSTVKEFLSTILQQEWETLKTPENINTELWVSRIIINKLSNKYKYFVAEMWAYNIWEIETLWNIVNHKYWFLTAIWIQHLWLFWSEENITKAKSEIAKKILENNWILYINWDNNKIRQINFDKKLNIVKYWLDENSDAKSKIISKKNWKTIFEFEYKNEKYEFEINFIWKHQIINITWVIAFCIDQWISPENIKKHLLKLKLPNNTLDIKEKIINNIKYIIINDTYNLSRDWLFAWLEVLNSFSKNYEKILVIDDILELWKDAKNIHFEIWKRIAEENLTDKIFYVWINYKKYFINWLIEWGYNQEKILKNIDIFKDKSIILFEWRKAWIYLNNF